MAGSWRDVVGRWARSAANFVWFALKPAPRWVNDVWGFVVALVLLVGAGALGDAVSGWPEGFVFLGLMLIGLVVIAGVRLQRSKDKADEVSLTFEDPYLADIGIGWQQLVVRVINNGAPSRFRASLLSDVSGISMPRYGRGVAIAWEQNATRDIELGTGETGTLRVARAYPKGSQNSVGIVRFVVPPGPDNPTAYGEGLPHPIEGASIIFDVGVRDVERDQVRSRTIEWDFDSDGYSEHQAARYIT